ncbi:hypothetical protein F66182_517 [Fusarium sp. NRRL 66182]|nr:hypothetical protein F66182_517 [Fusarium sp. NRRL 66182]
MSNGRVFSPDTRSILITSTVSEQSHSQKHPSTEAFPFTKTPSSSSDSAIIVAHNSPQPSLLGQDTQDPAMFSSLVSHTRVPLPQREDEGQAEADFGDFDHTPPPSGRTSVDMTRSKSEKPQESRANQGTKSRHRLLKTFLSGPMVPRKDDPIPPVLSPLSGAEPRSVSKGVAEIHDASDGTQAERLSATPGISPASSLSEDGAASHRIRIEPQMHAYRLSVLKNSIGLTNTVKSIDAAKAPRDEIPIWPSPDRSSFDSTDIYLEDD